MSTGLPPDIARALDRVADELHEHNTREHDAETAAALRAVRDERRITTSVRRGVLVVAARNGLWHTKVPTEYWAQSETGTYVISCTCGRSPVVQGYLVPASCECGRAFLYDGDDIRVDLPPTARPA